MFFITLTDGLADPPEGPAIVAHPQAWQADAQEAPTMSKKHKHDKTDAKADEAKTDGTDLLAELTGPEDPSDEPVKVPTAGADGPPEIDARPEAPQGGAECRTGDKAPKTLSVASTNVTDLRVATLAQRLATGKADALGVTICLYLSVAEGLVPKIDRAHLETWATHSGFSDIWRHAIWDALISSGFLQKDKADKGKWKLADLEATRQLGVESKP